MVSDDETRMNFAQNATENNADLSPLELDTDSPSYGQDPVARVLQHLGKKRLNCESFFANFLSRAQFRMRSVSLENLKKSVRKCRPRS